MGSLAVMTVYNVGSQPTKKKYTCSLMFFNMVNVRVTRMVRERIANPYHAGSTPVTYSIIGFKVFMDARWLVTPEEWGSLPPKAAIVKYYQGIVNRRINYAGLTGEGQVLI